MKQILPRVKEYGKKVGVIVLWAFAVLLALIGLIMLFTKALAGILLIMSGLCLVPILKNWIPIKSWQQIVACVVLFFAAIIVSPTSQTIAAPDGNSLQSSSLPSSPSINQEQVLTIKFDSGEYEGKISDNKPYGTGTLTYTDFGTYIGSFEGGKRNGTGSFTWKNGNVYSGEWKDDKLNGNGTIAFSDGSKLTAVFTNDEITTGDYTWTDGNGNYKMHVDNSNSELLYTLKADYSNGINYKGSFLNGNLSGRGTMVYPNVGTYTGVFENGKKSGDGQFIWADGDKFSGKWANDQMNGEGLYTFANGSTLSGNFESNIPQGTLTYTYQGTTYNTVWSSGKCTSITKA